MPTVHFNDFSGGHWGSLDPRRARPGMWHMENMVVTEDGLCCVRPGFKYASVSGNPSGAVWGLHYQPVTGKEGLAVVGSTVYRIAEVDGALTFTALTNNLDAEPTETVRFDFADPTMVYLTSAGDGVYVANLNTNAVTQIQDAAPADVPGGYCIRAHGDRLFVGGDDDEVIAYSEATDYSSFEGNFSHGYFFPAYTLQTVRDRLLIGGAGKGWWSLSGTVDTGSMRHVADLSPGKDQMVVRDDMERIWYFLQQDERGLVVTNGSTWDVDSYGHLQPPDTDIHGAFSYGNRDIVYLCDINGGTSGYWRSHEAWSLLNIDDADVFKGHLTRWASNLFLCAVKDGSTNKWAWLQCGTIRPGYPADTYADAGDIGSTDPVEGFLETREWYDPQGRNVKVNRVAVDCVLYNYDAGGGGTSGMKVTVVGRERWGDTSKESSGQSQYRTTTGLSSEPTGTRRRLVFGAGDQGPTGGFTVQLSEIKGAKIADVIVEYEFASDSILPAGTDED